MQLRSPDYWWARVGAGAMTAVAEAQHNATECWYADDQMRRLAEPDYVAGVTSFNLNFTFVA